MPPAVRALAAELLPRAPELARGMGRSGWWQLVPIVLGPVLIIGSAMSIGIGAILGEITNTDWAALAGVGGLLVSVAIAFFAVVGFTLWVGVAEGQPGENRYGEPPLTPLMA